MSRSFELTTDFEYDGQRYQIRRLSALDGSFIIGQLMTKMLPSAMGDVLSLVGVNVELPAGRSDMTRAEFEEIQAMALSVVLRYEEVGVVQVFIPPRTFAIKELEYDLNAVIALTAKSLAFNLSPFFQGNGFSAILQAMGLGLTFAKPQA